MDINSLYNLTDPKYFWREVIKYGFFEKYSSPKDWFLFRHEVGRECAIRRDPQGGPIKKDVEDLFPNIDQFEAVVKVGTPNAYNLSWQEIVTISQLVRMLAPKTLFEFGTFDGRTTLHLAINAPDDALIYTIDKEFGVFKFGGDAEYFGEISIGECFINTPAEKKIQILTGDTKRLDVSKFKELIEFIFVDADHSYNGVLNDSGKAFEMIRPGGLIVWHDYLMIDDVTRAIIEIGKDKNLHNLKGTSLVVWQS